MWRRWSASSTMPTSRTVARRRDPRRRRAAPADRSLAPRVLDRISRGRSRNSSNGRRSHAGRLSPAAVRVATLHRRMSAPTSTCGCSVLQPWSRGRTGTRITALHFPDQEAPSLSRPNGAHRTGRLVGSVPRARAPGELDGLSATTRLRLELRIKDQATGAEGSRRTARGRSAKPLAAC